MATTMSIASNISTTQPQTTITNNTNNTNYTTNTINNQCKKNNTQFTAYTKYQNKLIPYTTPPDFLISNCNGNIDLDSQSNINNLDEFFSQESINKMPVLTICNDIKRDTQSEDIFKKYTDIFYDNCGNPFNIKNLSSSASALQAGYSANIDLDSHLKNINYYNDKCFYDNWKLAPNSFIKDCMRVNSNPEILTPNYTAMGRNYNDCVGVPIPVAENAIPTQQPQCYNTPPTDINCETDIRKRYNFINNPNPQLKLQKESCIKPNEWVPFVKDNTKTNNEIQHDYYKFFENTQCEIYPSQRLFNNITKRSMMPNHHYKNISPIYNITNKTK